MTGNRAVHRSCLADSNLPSHWRIRQGTWDELIFREVVIDNQYGLHTRYCRNDVILDVGAHCGAFTWACVVRGAGTVLAYEVDGENFELLKHNLAPLGPRTLIWNVAVWRSDRSEDLFQLPRRRLANTGEGRVSNLCGVLAVQSVRFDEIVEMAAQRASNGRVRLAKLDVEGAEFPILYTSRTLRYLDELVAEYHERERTPLGHTETLPPFTVRDLAHYLKVRRFEVSWRETAPGVGILRAHHLGVRWSITG